MSTMAPVPKDHPLMIAWEAHKATEDYANSKRWASAVHKDAHLEGSLWALFMAGFHAASGHEPPAGLQSISLRPDLPSVELVYRFESLEHAEAARTAFARAAQPPPVVHSELELAAAHYVRVAQNPNLSRYITENGRHPGSGGPWAELVAAVDAATSTKCEGRS